MIADISLPLINFNISGVYCIKNKINNKIYVGSSKNIRQRLSRHNTCLKYKKHKNVHLQASYDKYGSQNFEFIILEIVDDLNNLEKREQYYLDFFRAANNKFGYNKVIDVVRMIFSKESLEKISKSRKFIKMSDEQRKRLSNSKRGKKWSDSQRESMNRFYSRRKKELEKKRKNDLWIKKPQYKGSRAIIKLSLDEKVLDRYESIADAGRVYHLDKIRYAIINSTIAFGYKWMYASSNLEERERKKRNSINRSGIRAVIKLSKDKKILSRYESCVDASKINNCSIDNIYKSCKDGKLRNGYYWMHAYTKYKITL